MNAIITEGEDDLHFLQALTRVLEEEREGTYMWQGTAMKSLNKKKLVEDLIGKIGEIRRGKIRRIGILIDQDTHE